MDKDDTSDMKTYVSKTLDELEEYVEYFATGILNDTLTGDDIHILISMGMAFFCIQDDIEKKQKKRWERIGDYINILQKLLVDDIN
jgi:hypothetical protein